MSEEVGRAGESSEGDLREHEAPETGHYSWAATYSAGTDAFVYRRFKGPLPAHVPVTFARDNPPARIVAFCEENNFDVALYDELRGIVRKPRLGTDEAP